VKQQSDQPDQPEQATAETLDHLQTAASEMIAAARSFLDAVEGVVHDRDAVASVVETFTTVAQAAAQAASRVNPTRRPSTGKSAGGAGKDEDDPPGVQHIRVS
jgi:hypothetical protein